MGPFHGVNVMISGCLTPCSRACSNLGLFCPLVSMKINLLLFSFKIAQSEEEQPMSGVRQHKRNSLQPVLTDQINSDQSSSVGASFITLPMEKEGKGMGKTKRS